MTTDALLRISTQGSAARKGAELLDADAPAMSMAIRRALPFLMRRGVVVAPKPVFAGTARELDGRAMLPGVALSFGDGAVGHVALDRRATDILVDGVLGGDGRSTDRSPGLTPAQSALASRLTQTVGRCIAERLATRFATKVVASPSTTTMPTDGVFFLCFIEIGDGPEAGTIVLAVPRSVLGGLDLVKNERFTTPEPAVRHLLGEVEVDVAVHLGTVHVPLKRLMNLGAGAVLLTEVPVSGSVTVHVDEKPLFSGRPTAVGGRFAVRVEHKLDG